MRIVQRALVLAPVLALSLAACGGGASQERTALLDQLRQQGVEAGVPEPVVACLIDRTAEFTDIQLKSMVDNTMDDATGSRAAEILDECRGDSQ
jgi:hypothetical protein